METRGTNRFDDEADLKQELLRRIDDGDTYRELAEETFYVSGRKRNVSPAQISRWRKQAASADSGRMEGTTDGEIAAEAFKLFEEGATPSKVVIALKQAPSVISELYDSWTELSGYLVVDSHTQNHIQNTTNYPVEDQASLMAAIGRLITDHKEFRGFRYACHRCGVLVQATNEVWNWVVQKGYLATWGHAQCPIVKQA